MFWRKNTCKIGNKRTGRNWEGWTKPLGEVTLFVCFERKIKYFEEYKDLLGNVLNCSVSKKKQPLTKHFPFIFLTAKRGNEEMKVEIILPV